MNYITKTILIIIVLTLLNGCVTNSNVSEKNTTPSQQDIVKAEKEDMMWAMPTWCENLKQEPFQIKACGIAKSSNLQTSRTRSALDARKQITKILSQRGPMSSIELGAEMYQGFTSSLAEVAQNNILSHLIDLTDRRLTEYKGTVSFNTYFSLIQK